MDEVGNGCTNNLQTQVWMEINTLTKHLLTANTPETCASDLRAGTEPHSRWHLTTTAFVKWQRFEGLSKMWCPETTLGGNIVTQKLKCFFVFQPRKIHAQTIPPTFPPSPSPSPNPSPSPHHSYKNISRNANSSSSFKSAFLDNIEEDHSYAVCLTLPCVQVIVSQAPELSSCSGANSVFLYFE